MQRNWLSTAVGTFTFVQTLPKQPFVLDFLITEKHSGNRSADQAALQLLPPIDHQQTQFLEVTNFPITSTTALKLKKRTELLNNYYSVIIFAPHYRNN